MFGITLLRSITTTAPNRGCLRAFHNTEIPFRWLTGFLLSRGFMCLLTPYCKRQMPSKSRVKVKEGFCQEWKRTWGQSLPKGLARLWITHRALVWQYYSMNCDPQCLHGCGCVHLDVPSPFPRLCSCADCSAPSLVAAPPSFQSLRCWALAHSHETLSHCLVTG